MNIKKEVTRTSFFVSKMADLHRLKKEMTDCGRVWEESGVHAEVKDSDLTNIIARIKGPQDSPYERGVFHVEVKIPSNYPFEPPKMRFITKIWHPNVSSQTGAICLDILKNAWSPALTIKTTLLSLQALLSAPEPNDPQDAEVAKMYKSDYKKWVATAAFWTESYAVERPVGSPHPVPPALVSSSTAAGSGSPAVAVSPPVVQKKESDPRIAALLDMGFDRTRAVEALRRKNGNVELAIELLFTDFK